MSKTYTIRTVADLFAVPIEKRAAMFRDLELGMSLTELALGDKAAEATKALTWVDDGEKHVSLSVNGQADFLKLEVTRRA